MFRNRCKINKFKLKLKCNITLLLLENAWLKTIKLYSMLKMCSKVSELSETNSFSKLTNGHGVYFWIRRTFKSVIMSGPLIMFCTSCSPSCICCSILTITHVLLPVESLYPHWTMHFYLIMKLIIYGILLIRIIHGINPVTVHRSVLRPTGNLVKLNVYVAKQCWFQEMSHLNLHCLQKPSITKGLKQNITIGITRFYK